MDIKEPLSIEKIANLINGTIQGDKETRITGISEVFNAEPGDITYANNKKYFLASTKGKASTIITNHQHCIKSIKTAKPLIFVDDPLVAFNLLLSQFFHKVIEPEAGIDKTALIGKNSIIGDNPCISKLVTIGKDCAIGDDFIALEGVRIGDNVKIGTGCFLWYNVVIYDNCILGNNVTVHAGTVIGSDAYAYHKNQKNKTYIKRLCRGGVSIDNDVDVGSNVCIDRGIASYTHIGSGTKIDNLVQIGHDANIGKNVLLVAQVGIAGEAIVEDDAILWGQSALASGAFVGQGSQLLGQSGVSRVLPKGAIYVGTPARDSNKVFESQRLILSLPKTIKRLKKLEESLEALANVIRKEKGTLDSKVIYPAEEEINKNIQLIVKRAVESRIENTVSKEEMELPLEQLGVDSLDIIEIVMAIEEEIKNKLGCSISEFEVPTSMSINNIIDLLIKEIHLISRSAEYPIPAK